MNRYAYTSEEPEPHILPNQMWCKKAYPFESVIIASYSGDGDYVCLPWIQQHENACFPSPPCPMNLNISYLKRYYELKQSI